MNLKESLNSGIKALGENENLNTLLTTQETDVLGNLNETAIAKQDTMTQFNKLVENYGPVGKMPEGTKAQFGNGLPPGMIPLSRIIDGNSPLAKYAVDAMESMNIIRNKGRIY